MQAKRCLAFDSSRIAAVFLGALLLFGCQPDPSGSDPSSAPSAETEAPSAEPPNAARTPVDPCELSVGWDPWEPYHFLAIGGAPRGLDVEIVRAVAARADCELDFLQGGWDGLLRLLRAGELDLMLGATRTPAREAWARFSEPYRSERFRLFVLERLAEEHSGQDLEALLDDGFRLGITQGYYYGPEISALIERDEYGNRILQAAVGELNLTRLLDMQIDGFIEDPFVFAAMERRRRDAEPIVSLPRDLASGPVSFMFSRASVDEDVVARFNAGIQALQASGRHQELLDQYLE